MLLYNLLLVVKMILLVFYWSFSTRHISVLDSYEHVNVDDQQEDRLAPTNEVEVERICGEEQQYDEVLFGHRQDKKKERKKRRRNEFLWINQLKLMKLLTNQLPPFLLL
eukprot:GHVS01057059.1.p2 GENE.GHVS01057059.1~~GHVS01057059.1.p2  ORF type:complete len:109 (+),score=25.70 GHVS01057059.1:516-842(+)